jgi:uncharacterized membrane protein
MSSHLDKLGTTIGHTVREVVIALAPIVLFFFILQFLFMKLHKKRIRQIIVGLFYTFFGLVIFLSAVAVGFMPIGFKMGTELAQQNSAVLVVVAFALGFAVVLAEPAIHVLKNKWKRLRAEQSANVPCLLRFPSA